MPPVNLVSPDGRTRAVEQDSPEYQFAIDSGWTPESGVDAAGQAGAAFARQGLDLPGAGILAGGAAVARGVTGGLSDVALNQLGGGEFFGTLREEHPYLSAGGEIVGGLSPLGAGGIAARAGERVAARIGGASIPAQLARATVGTGVEGGIQGLGQGVTELALSDDPLTVERIGSAIGSNILFGTSVGGGLGAIGKGAELGLVKASRKLKSIAEAGEQGAVPELSDVPPAPGWRGVPQYEAIPANDELLTTVRAGDLRQAQTDSVRDLAKADRYRGVREAAGGPLPEGHYLAQPIKMTVAPDGGLGLTDGWHRLASAPDDALVQVRFERGQVGTGTKPPASADDFAGLSGKGLRAAKDAELQAIEAARQPERGVLAEDISAFRQELKESKLWLATKASKEAPTPVAPELPASTIPDRVEVVRSGRNYEVRTYRNGAAEPEVQTLGRNETYDALNALAPDGFKAGSVDINAKGGLETGIPASAADVNRASVYVVRPSDLAKRGIAGNAIHDDHLTSVKQAWSEGVRLAPVDIDMTPDGRLFIEDGNHRLLAAAVDDRPVLAKFRAVGDNWKPQAGAIDVSDRLRSAAPAPAPSAPSAPVALPKPDREVREIAKISLEADRALDRILRNPKALAEAPKRSLGALQQQEHALERLLAKSDELKLAYAADKSGDRLAALEIVPAALERNRALQQRIADLVAEPMSARLRAIQEAQDLLSSGARKAPVLPDAGIGSQMLGGSAFGMAAGVVGSVPVIGPLLAPLAGAAASRLVTGRVAGRVNKAVAEAAAKTARVVDAFTDTARRAAPYVPVIATKVLANLRFAEAATDEKPMRRPTLAQAFKARSEEVRSQVALGPDGVPRMRPEARQRMAEKLAPLRMLQPLLADRIETLAARRLEFLAGKLPRRPELTSLPTGPDRWQPSDMQMREWARYAAAVEDPDGVEARLVSGGITPEDAEAMREVYPERMEAIKMDILAKLPTLKKQLPYNRRLALSIFSGVPVDPAMNPKILRVLQSAFADEPGSEGGTMAPQASPAFGSVRSMEKPTQAQERAG